MPTQAPGGSRQGQRLVMRGGEGPEGGLEELIRRAMSTEQPAPVRLRV